MKKIIFISLFFCLSAGAGVLAAAPIEEGELIYEFHLIYDRGTLSIDPAFQFPYDITVEEFEPEHIVSSTAYYAQVISFKGEELAVTPFDPQRGNPSFQGGPITVRLPYFDNAARVVFSREGGELLSVSVSEVAICNEDGMCTAVFVADRHFAH